MYGKLIRNENKPLPYKSKTYSPDRLTPSGEEKGKLGLISKVKRKFQSLLWCTINSKPGIPS